MIYPGKEATVLQGQGGDSAGKKTAQGAEF